MSTVDYGMYGNAGRLLARAQEYGIPIRELPDDGHRIVIRTWMVGNELDVSPHTLAVYYAPPWDRRQRERGRSSVRLIRRWHTPGSRRAGMVKITLRAAYIHLRMFKEEHDRYIARTAEKLLTA